jgi:hypothetical protein
MLIEKMENILCEAMAKLQREIDDSLDVLPDSDVKRMRRLIDRVNNILDDSCSERSYEEWGSPRGAGPATARAPAKRGAPAPMGAPAPIAATALTDRSAERQSLQERAEQLYPLMAKRPRKK